jgi:hypothetical protein
LVHLAVPRGQGVTAQHAWRIDQIEKGEEVLSMVPDLDGGGHVATARVKEIWKCWSKHPQNAEAHDAVVFPPGSLALGEPSHQLVIDTGHPICRQSDYEVLGDSALQPAATHVNVNSRIHVAKWTDSTLEENYPDHNNHINRTNTKSKSEYVRYDLELEPPHTTYLANGIVVLARKSGNDAGYMNVQAPYT